MPRKKWAEPVGMPTIAQQCDATGTLLSRGEQFVWCPSHYIVTRVIVGEWHGQVGNPFHSYLLTAEASTGIVFEKGSVVKGEGEEGEEGRRKWEEEGGAPLAAMLHQKELQNATYAVGKGEGRCVLGIILMKLLLSHFIPPARCR